MSLSRIISSSGKVMIFLGLLVVGFVIYQLWGTGLQHSLAQDRLENQFQDLLEEVDDLEAANVGGDSSNGLPDGVENEAIGTATLESANEASSENTEDGASPEETEDTSSEETVLISSLSQRGDFSDKKLEYSPAVLEYIEYLNPEAGAAVAELKIPKIGISEIIVEGTNLDDLKRGPGHYTGSPLPGQAGNVAIGGHRTTYGAPFHRLNDLKEGDEVILETLQGIFTYEVVHLGEEEDEHAYKVVNPGAVEEVSALDGNFVTLTACHPRYSAEKRIIVRAELKGDPVVSLPRTAQISEDVQEIVFIESAPALISADTSGFSGNLGSLGPASLWGAALLALLAAAWFAARRWNKWMIYSISLMPVLGAVLMIYYYVEDTLPTY